LIELLRYGWRICVVVSVEGAEGAKCGPTGTELFCRIISITANV